LKLEKRDHLGALDELKGMILKRFIKVFTLRIYTKLARDMSSGKPYSKYIGFIKCGIS
jgi:hypothetical protein